MPFAIQTKLKILTTIGVRQNLNGPSTWILTRNQLGIWERWPVSGDLNFFVGRASTETDGIAVARVKQSLSC
jgi:hypothetical protein